ncbi:MAG TPA: 50S ribosomal protein L21 [Flavobacteriia bacterium]|nr:50S ribosomal protein L21 [Flavobacteriia bacterium]
MYAIVEIAGQQFKVKKDQKVFVHRLSEEVGSNVKFDKVFLLDDGNVTVGAPVIEGAAVNAKILNHLKGDKVIVFKKKRRKGYKVKNGHRQYLTEIVIESIEASGAKPTKKAKKEAVKKETPTKKAAPKKATSKGDDLKKIEGIGPKIAEIFNNAGITTFAKLAETTVEKLQEILAAAGPRYASKKPGSWPKQAKMAAEGKWDELKEWQDAHDHGIE